VGRGRGQVPADGAGPIYVCTRNDALAGVIADCPPARKGDLVFYGHALALPRASPPAATPPAGPLQRETPPTPPAG